MRVEETRLGNGINVVFVNYPETKLISSNVIVNTGGRNESKENFGISHFIEHMAFKGTKSYPHSEIYNEEIEGKGGVINAWTSEQATCYWNIMPDDKIDVSLKTLSEQITALILDPKEIEMERGPILEEIKRAHDDPYSFVYHKIYEVMWPGQPISGGVLGPEENIEKFTKKDFLEYIEARYVGENITICIVSSLDAKVVLEKINKFFSGVVSKPSATALQIKNDQDAPRLELIHRDIKQAHVLLAYKSFGVTDKRGYALDVLINILGTGMSSTLFKEVREKRGLAYAIRADIDYFSDAGAVLLYFGLNKEKAAEAISMIRSIIKDSGENKQTEERINQAKEFIKGITLYRMDGVERLASWYTTKSLFDKANMDPEKYISEIMKVTAEDMVNVANDILVPKNETLLVLGPFKDKDKFAKIQAEQGV